MTRKSYETLLSELSEARQYINVLIHDTTYAVVNAHAYPHEFARIKTAAREMAVLYVPANHDINAVKRAIHTRHPGVILIALPIPDYFVAILEHDAESWCNRVKAALNKARQESTLAWVPCTGNPTLDFLTCRELIQLTNTAEVNEWQPF